MLFVKGIISIVPSALFAFSLLMKQYANQAVGVFPGIYRNFKTIKGIINRIRETETQEIDINKSNIYNPQNIDSIIEIKKLSFNYDQTNVLDDISINIRKGEKVAIVGNSGCGKSTFVNILAGLYTEYSGSIKLKGSELKEWDNSELYKLITLVPQEDFIYPYSIKKNLLMSIDSNSYDLVDNVMKMININGISKKNGNQLSGGQKQRTSLARGILKNSPVLLLDEPTSELDIENEKQLLETIYKELPKDNTLIVVTHRIYTVQNFDKIVVIDNGKIIAIGKHQDLLSNKFYQNLYYIEGAVNE